MSDGSRILAPAPLTVVFPMAWTEMFLERIGLRSRESAIVPAIAVFYSVLLLGHLTRKQASQIPRASVLVFWSFAVANGLFWWLALPVGIEYQGIKYTTSVILLNVFLFALAFLILKRSRHLASFWTSYCFHVVFALWVCWIAFPWLGEMP